MNSRIALTTLLAYGCGAPAEGDENREAVGHETRTDDPTSLRFRRVRVKEDVVLAATRSQPATPVAPTAQLGSCEDAGCTLSVRFDQPMGELGKMPSFEALGVRVFGDGPHELRWNSVSELQIVPKRGSFAPGQVIRVEVDAASFSGETQVPYFVAAAKTAAWPVTVGKPRLVDVLDDRTRRVGRGPVYLLYDQPVELTRSLRARFWAADSGGAALPIRVFRPEDVSRVTDESVPLDHVIAVRFGTLPSPGQVISLRVPSVRDEERSESLELTVSEVRPPSISEDSEGLFQTSPWLVPSDSRLRFSFAAPVRSAAFRQALEIDPPPARISISTYGADHFVALAFEPGTVHRVRLGSGLEDILGNSAGGLEMRVRARDLPPRLVVPTEPVALERGRARVGLRLTNISELSPEVFLLDPASFISALRQGQADCATLSSESIKLPRVRVAAAANEAVLFEIPIDLGSKRRSQLCVRVQGKGTGSEAGSPLSASMLAQSSGLGVTTKISPRGGLVFVTRLSDAKPVRGATIELLDASGQALVGDKKTLSDGVARFDLELPADSLGELFGVVRSGDDSIVTRLSEAELSSPWHFGLPGDVPVLEAAVFTDRGVYRPGESVELKVIARPDGRRPELERVRLSIRDSRGQSLEDRELATDGFGAAHSSLSISKSAPTGEYEIEVTAEGRTARRTFRVEEYRVPTFRVVVDLPEAVVEGPAAATVKASYLFGGALGDRPVKWQISREPAVFAPNGFERFVFGRGGAPTLVASGDGRLGSDGSRRVELQLEAPGRPYRYTVDASVTDLDRQTWAGRVSRTVHGADVYVGLAMPRRAVYALSEPIEVTVATVNQKGEPVVSSADVRLVRIDHHSAVRATGSAGSEISSHAVSVPVESCAVTTNAAGVASCELSVQSPGVYEVRASARDARGRESGSAYGLTVGGDGMVAWPRFDHERIEVIADRPRYSVGDVARLVVKAPFADATVLVTVERDKVLTHRLTRISGDTPIIEVPITAAYAPNVFASLVVLRGRTHGEVDATGFETGSPAFRMGYAQLQVDDPSLTLPVAAKPDRPSAGPGETLILQISTGAKRKARATVAVVDEAVLAMTRFSTPEPVSQLHPRRGLGTRTAETRLDLPFARRERREQVFPSGDGGDGFALSSMPDELRKLMKSTAYWNPDVPLDTKGNGTVSFELPDNLTTYRIMVVAYDGAGSAGSAESKIVVRKALMAQPVLPRFLRAGDTFRLEARVFDGTGEGGVVDGKFELEGLELDKREPSRPDNSLKGRARLDQRTNLLANGSASFELPVVVTGRGQAKVRFAAALGTHRDAVESTVPILETGGERKLVISKAVSGAESIELSLPAGRVPGTSKLEILASSTSLSELKDSVQYLMQYPNGCIEQTTSTAYPLVMLKDLLPEMGVTVDASELEKFSKAGVERILSFQTTAGGLSYWPGGSEPHAFATAFGLTALIEAKKRGYDVPNEKLSKMADFLETTLARGAVTEQIPHGAIADGDTRALFVMTLGRLGRPQPAWISTLWRERGKLTPFGLGFLAVALQESAGDQSLMPEVLAEIRKKATETKEEAFYELARKGGYSFDSPLRSHATALLAFAGSNQNEGSAKLLHGLLKRKNGYGIWGNTQENVFGIMAVAKMTAPTSVGSAPSLSLALDGRALPTPKPGPRANRTVRLDVDEAMLAAADVARTHRLHVASESKAPVNVTARVAYEVSLESPENRRPWSNGFTVSRTVTTLDGAPTDEVIALGSLLRVTLDVETDQSHNYVAVADPLPAGFEALNAALDTTEKVSLGEVTPEVTNGLTRLSHSEVRDARVAFFADALPAGRYRWVYVARATTKGRFLRPAAKVEEMYQESTSAGTVADFVEVR
ncbi:MAG: hypothetical protein HY791_04200 [Deltaproteobacteria bacterium]|nr:hypothetical protein [Deltaproteobacteria bacterium]